MRLVVKNKFCDSSLWDYVEPRETDIVINTCYKAGTTLTQQIVNLLIYGNSNFKNFKYLHDLSPWVELWPDPDYPSLEQKMAHINNLPEPRFLKTHVPFEAMPYHPEWKYIYLVRDGRDVALSLYNFRAGYDPEFWEVAELETFLEFWDKWLENGFLWPFWEHTTSWWNVRHLPNMLFIHYGDLIEDKLKQVERIANFLGIEFDDAKKEIVMEQSSLEYMKEYWEKFQPVGFLPQKFFGKGKNGCWQELLPAEKVTEYEKLVVEKLGLECANWVANGGIIPLPEPSLNAASQD